MSYLYLMKQRITLILIYILSFYKSIEALDTVYSSNEFDFSKQETTWSGTLPVMFITTEYSAPIISKSEYIKATYWLDPMGIEGIDSIGSAKEQAAIQIKGRGNWIWTHFDKKPYRIKPDKKTPLMGMDKSKHFALLAHADDSMAVLRNTIGFAASEACGMPWTPATQPLEEILNGDSIGLY